MTTFLRFPAILPGVLFALFATARILAADPATPTNAPATANPSTNSVVKDSKHARESDAFFAGPIQAFDLRIGKAAMDSLRRQPRTPVAATVFVGTNRFESVLVHVKGAAGSSRSIDDNPALTLNFDKQNPGQRLQGLDKIHLNNSVQDPSRLSEMVCSDLYLAAGIPTPRATQAFVKLNGRDLGLYVLKEGFNKSFLARHFTNRTGNLYDGGFLRDIDQDLERDSGEGPDTHADLHKLHAAAAIGDGQRRKAALSAVLDMDRFATYTAMQVLTEDWDGYACNRNNYRIYHDPGSDKFVFFPHGMDQMFDRGGMPLQRNFAGLVAERTFQIAEFRELYWQKVASLMDTVFTTQRMFAVIDAAAKRRIESPAAKGRNDVHESDDAARELKNRIAFRVRNAREQLGQRPRPANFDAKGEFRFANWSTHSEDGPVKATRVTDKEGHPVLQLSAKTGGAGSFRARARLPAGHYKFEAKATTVDVVPLQDERGRGLGLRLSGGPRTNQMTGTTGWQVLSHEFVLDSEGDVELVGELRAASGTGWFDPASMVVRKVP